MGFESSISYYSTDLRAPLFTFNQFVPSQMRRRGIPMHPVIGCTDPSTAHSIFMFACITKCLGVRRRSASRLRV